MTSVPVRTLILAGVFAVSALIPCAAVLRAQEVTEVPVSGPQDASVRDKVADTISGIKSGDISAAKKVSAFDTFLRNTFIRISDSWTLCKQEMGLAREASRQEAVQTAKEIFSEGKEITFEQTRESILEKLPFFGSSEKEDLSLDLSVSSDLPASSSYSSSSISTPINSNNPTKIRESIQSELSTPVTPGSDLSRARENVQSMISTPLSSSPSQNREKVSNTLDKPVSSSSDLSRTRQTVQDRIRGN